MLGKTSWMLSYLFGAYSAIFGCIECEIWQLPREPLCGSYTGARALRVMQQLHTLVRAGAVRGDCT